MPLDLTITPIYRLNGQEAPSLPGLLALAPPPNAARGRERDHLVAYLLLAGTASFSTGEYAQVAQDAAEMFYQTSGALTTALRAAAELVNATLLERNMTTSQQGQYAVGWLTLAALRDNQATLSLSGPMHVYHYGAGEARHVHEPTTSGKGLGASPAASIYYAQATLNAGDRLLFFGRAPEEWELPLKDATPMTLGATRRRLVALAKGDLNAVLMQATEGKGLLNLLKGTEEIVEAKPVKKEEPQPAAPPPVTPAPPREEPAKQPDAAPAHVVQPAGYAPPRRESPPQEKDPLASLPRVTAPQDFPASIPRIQKPADSESLPPPPLPEEVVEAPPPRKKEKSVAPRQVRPRGPSERTRQTARAAASFIQWSRGVGDAFSSGFNAFLPRVLPSSEVDKPHVVSNFTMLSIALIVPLVVVVMAFVTYEKYGRSQTYEAYLRQAQQMRAQAAAVVDPIGQRKSWENVLLNVEKAEANGGATSETETLRREASESLDRLLNVTRLQFNPAFSSNPGINISRMAANDFELYMLNAETGEVLRAQPTDNGRGFQMDRSFVCSPGQYGEYQVGPIVDILALPGLNEANATLLGIDAQGYLLYCAAGQLPQARPLPEPDTGWERVTAFTLDNGNLYVLDSDARAVWIYTGQNATYLDRPYFFFGNQTPEKRDAIDLIVSGDELFMLHGDGRLSTCSYSRIEAKPTRCQDPTPLLNPIPAYQDIDLFASANFTQAFFAMPPDASLLLLNADTQSVLRFSPRSFELQNQLMPATKSVPPGTVGALAFSPNHVLYVAVDGQVYFARNMP